MLTFLCIWLLLVMMITWKRHVHLYTTWSLACWKEISSETESAGCYNFIIWWRPGADAANKHEDLEFLCVPQEIKLSVVRGDAVGWGGKRALQDQGSLWGCAMWAAARRRVGSAHRPEGRTLCTIWVAGAVVLRWEWVWLKGQKAWKAQRNTHEGMAGSDQGSHFGFSLKPNEKAAQGVRDGSDLTGFMLQGNLPSALCRMNNRRHGGGRKTQQFVVRPILWLHGL